MQTESLADRRARKAAYQAARRKKSVLLSFTTEDELRDFQQMAEEAGYANFNAYLLQLLHNATSGSLYPPEYVEGLKADNAKLRSWHEQARDEAAEYRADVRKLRDQRDTLLRNLHDLPDGAEIAARFLAA